MNGVISVLSRLLVCKEGIGFFSILHHGIGAHKIPSGAAFSVSLQIPSTPSLAAPIPFFLGEPFLKLGSLSPRMPASFKKYKK